MSNINNSGNWSISKTDISDVVTLDYVNDIGSNKLNIYNMWDSSANFKTNLDQAIKSYSEIVSMLEEIKDGINDLDNNKAKLLLKSKIYDKRDLWYMGTNYPELSQLIQTNFGWSDDAIEEFYQKYAKVKIKEDFNNE
jgi:hypothetical protein